MENELKLIHKDIEDIRQKIDLIRHILEEKEELSDWSKKELTNARKASKEDYISQNNLKKKVLLK